MKKKIYLFIKRIFDIVVGIIGTIFMIPFTLIIALLFLVTKDFGPVFYKQKRIGKNGKYFYMFKYRTMIKNADKYLKEYLDNNPEEKKYYEENWKLEHDPRITKIGNFLRKTSLDELPQSLNLIIGNMSVVGPRPIVDKEIEKYGDKKEKFLSVKPGITGYWQVNGRSLIDYNTRVNMELHYVDNQSLLFDTKIILKTFGSVLRQEGAK